MKSDRAPLWEEFYCRTPTVGIRYCGGCNPAIDRLAVVNRLKSLAVSGGSVVRFKEAQEAVDAIVFVNGCSHACLEEEAAGEMVPWHVSIQGEHVDCRPVDEKRLAEVVWQKILQKFQR
jgi:hypothetical protein